MIYGLDSLGFGFVIEKAMNLRQYVQNHVIERLPIWHTYPDNFKNRLKSKSLLFLDDDDYNDRSEQSQVCKPMQQGHLPPLWCLFSDFMVKIRRADVVWDLDTTTDSWMTQAVGSAFEAEQIKRDIEEALEPYVEFSESLKEILKILKSSTSEYRVLVLDTLKFSNLLEQVVDLARFFDPLLSRGFDPIVIERA